MPRSHTASATSSPCSASCRTPSRTIGLTRSSKTAPQSSTSARRQDQAADGAALPPRRRRRARARLGIHGKGALLRDIDDWMRKGCELPMRAAPSPLMAQRAKSTEVWASSVGQGRWKSSRKAGYPAFRWLTSKYHIRTRSRGPCRP